MVVVVVVVVVVVEVVVVGQGSVLQSTILTLDPHCLPVLLGC